MMKVYFENLSAGWVNLKVLKHNKIVLDDYFSYTPYDTFRDLIDVIYLLHTVDIIDIDRKVIFNTEPMEYEFHFLKNNDTVTLIVSRYKDQRRVGESCKKVFSCNGSYKEICIPFWKGLRRLQSEFEPDDMDKAWHRIFPNLDLNKLTKMLKG